MELFPLCSSLPLHTPAIQLFPTSSVFSVFCHTSASCLNPHLNSTVLLTGFPCSSFQCFFFFFTLSLTPFLLDSRLHNLFTSQLNCMASTFRWQQTEFLYQRYWAVYKHDFPHRCVLFICVNVSRSSCQQCLLESCK